MRKPILALAALFLAAAAAHAPASAQDNSFANPGLKPSISPLQNARIDGIDPDNGLLSITDCAQPKADPGARPVCQGTAFHLTVSDSALRTQLTQFHLGDHIRIAFRADNTVSAIGGPTVVHIGIGYRLLMLFACALVTYAIGAIFTWGHPLKLIVGLDNRYSNSKLQVAVWFLVLIATYLEVLYFRVAVAGADFLGGINIPQNLLLLSGMSALTFAGAKGITTAKINAAANAAQNPAPQNPAAPAAAAPPPNPPAPNVKTSLNPGQESFWRDIIQSDLGTFDFGDFQMVIVTLLAVGIYLLGVLHYLSALGLTSAATLPDVDTTILSTFGLGQGAYLAKKAVANLGS